LKLCRTHHLYIHNILETLFKFFLGVTKNHLATVSPGPVPKAIKYGYTPLEGETRGTLTVAQIWGVLFFKHHETENVIVVCSVILNILCIYRERERDTHNYQ
jgi:hypothetical protein